MNALWVLVLVLQDPAAAERLLKATGRAQAELKEFRARVSAEEKRQEQALEELRSAVKAEAQALVALHESIGPLRTRLDAERKERKRLAEQLDEAKDLVPRAADLARSLRSDLEDLRAARLLPPSEPLPPPAADPAQEIEALVTVLLGAVRDAGALDRGPREITAPDGRVKRVELLRAGAVFAGYRDPATGAVGVSVRGPDGQGRRWTEAIDPGEKKLVEQALAAGAGFVRVPVDVAQALTIDASMADKSFGAFVASGGPVMIPLGIVALLSIVLCVERFLTYARQGGHRDDGVAEVLRLAKQSAFADAERRAGSMQGTVSRALMACLAARQGGRAGMESALQEALLHESPRLERFLPLLAVLAGVAPMLGLLGTVAGIIATFEVIALIGRGDPALMAGGISEALVATGTGLFVAIPLLVLHSYFAGRVERIVGDAERHGASLINGVSAQKEAVDVGRDR